MFTPDQIIQINQTVDVIHSYFPYIGFIACVFIFESYLPSQKVLTHPESKVERGVFKIKFWAISLFATTWFSQAILGGCLVHIPQNALNHLYFGRPLHDFGLFYRENLPAGYLPFLRTFYLFLFIYTAWRSVIFYRKYIAKSNTDQSNYLSLKV
jgi:hypothetical protein